jgi:hypothetical protein
VPTRRKNQDNNDSVEQAENPFQKATGSAVGQILALRELAEIVKSHVLPLDDSPITQVMTAFLDALGIREDSSANGLEESANVIGERQDEENDKPYKIEANSEGGISFSVRSREAADSLLVLLEEARKRVEIADRAPLMRRSLLAMAVSSFEALVGNLIEEYLRRHNSALGSSDKEFSLDDLLHFSNLQEAIEDLMSKRIEDFTRRSIRDWQRWFDRNLSVSFEDLVPDWDRTHEIFERRNLVMHSDCRVTSQYLSQVSPYLVENVRRGDQLEVDDEYLDFVLDEVLAFALLLGFRTWIKLVKKDTQKAADWLLHH